MNAEEEFEKFISNANLPTRSQFFTQTSCTAAREKAIFKAALAIGRKAGLEEVIDIIKSISLEDDQDGDDESARVTVENIISTIRQQI